MFSIFKNFVIEQMVLPKMNEIYFWMAPIFNETHILKYGIMQLVVFSLKILINECIRSHVDAHSHMHE